MFRTYVGAMEDASAIAYLRPETAQGIFVNFRNVLDTSRVKIPFGIAQIGKAFRNEVTPRNYIFRSREFEQMEIEFFVRPEEAPCWFIFGVKRAMQWWQSIGFHKRQLAHTRADAKKSWPIMPKREQGAATSNTFPFTDPGFGELEGIAHRTDYDLRQHARAFRPRGSL